MNRDEKISRGPGLPPRVHDLGCARGIYPSDGFEGTWIAANDYGIALAVLNWNDVPSRGANCSVVRSRGLVIPALIASQSLADLRVALDLLNLEGMSPFRLVGVFPSEMELWEWRWNCATIDAQGLRWEPQHWFSSSISDNDAGSVRGAVCRSAWNDPDAGSSCWLQKLHASHENGPGPFSICVHRDEVKTLSYSQVTWSPAEVQFDHFVGSPCTMEFPPVKNERPGITTARLKGQACGH